MISVYKINKKYIQEQIKIIEVNRDDVKNCLAESVYDTLKNKYTIMLSERNGRSSFLELKSIMNKEIILCCYII